MKKTFKWIFIFTLIVIVFSLIYSAFKSPESKAQAKIETYAMKLRMAKSTDELDEAYRLLGLLSKEYNFEFVKTKVDSLHALRSEFEASVQSKLISENATMAYIMAKDFIKDRLKSPSTAKFASYSDSKTNVTYNKNEGYYTVTVWVDSQNSFGAMLRKTFQAKVRPTNNDIWELVSINEY